MQRDELEIVNKVQVLWRCKNNKCDVSDDDHEVLMEQSESILKCVYHDQFATVTCGFLILKSKAQLF